MGATTRAMTAAAAPTRAWTALGGCMVIAGVSQGAFTSCFPLWVIPWIGEYHVLRGTAVSGFAVGNLVMGMISPVVGICIERFPARWSMAAGGTVLATGFMLGALVSSFWQLVALYASVLACGAAFAGVLPAQSVAVRIFPDKAGMASGAVTLGTSGGGVALPALLTAPLAALGWRSAFLLTAVIVLLTIVPSACFLLKRYDSPAPEPGNAPVGHAASMRLSEIVRTRAFWVPLIGIVPAMILVGAVLANAVVIAGDSGIALQEAGYLVCAIPAGGTIGSLGLGWLCDRMDYRRVFAVAAGASILALLALRSHLTPLPMGLAFGIIGLVVGAAFPVVAVMLVRSFGPRLYPRIMGLLMPPMIVAMAVAPVIAGWLRDRTGSYDSVFGACAALMLLSGTGIVALGARPKRLSDADDNLYPAS